MNGLDQRAVLASDERKLGIFETKNLTANISDIGINNSQAFTDMSEISHKLREPNNDVEVEIDSLNKLAGDMAS